MSICDDTQTAVGERIGEVLTQYRESPNLLFLLRTYLTAAVEAHKQVCDLPAKFDLETAVGDQLTLIGKRLGFPRAHCVCTVQPVFGFDCGNPDQPIAGFCEDNSTWSGCGEFGIGEVIVTNDDLYRRLLKVRIRQSLALFNVESLEAAIQDLWGPEAKLLESVHGRIVVAPGRDLTGDEISILQLYPRVLPVALGIGIRLHFGSTKVFGFGEGWGGFCEPKYPDGLPLVTGTGDLIVDEGDNFIITGPLTEDAECMCPVDVRPYTC